MRYSPLVLFLAGVCPLAADTAQDLEYGKAVFRSNCAFCHGLDGRGGRGPSLVSGRLTHGSADEDLRAVIRNGVPGTTMPAFESMDKDELDKLVLYLRHLASGAGSTAPVPGDKVKGQQVYARNACASCHRIGSEGSIFGPDLSRVGAGRSTEYIRESIVNPSADIPQEYEGVTVVTRDGRRIQGIRINEDTFTVQLRDSSQNFQLFRKDAVREVIHEAKSLMPAYASLAAEDMTNLLAYLDSLRGELKTGVEAKKPEGIR